MDFNNNERNNQDPNKRKKNKTNLLILFNGGAVCDWLDFS